MIKLKNAYLFFKQKYGSKKKPKRKKKLSVTKICSDIDNVPAYAPQQLHLLKQYALDWYRTSRRNIPEREVLKR
jgi:hypothetical protein